MDEVSEAEQPTVVASIVRGGCIACHRGGLVVGEEGHIWCTHADCPDPRAVDTLLRTGGWVAGPSTTEEKYGEQADTQHSNTTYPFWDGDTLVRGPGVIQSEGEPGKHLLTVDGENYVPQPSPGVDPSHVQIGQVVEITRVQSGKVLEIDENDPDMRLMVEGHGWPGLTGKGITVRVLEDDKPPEELVSVIGRAVQDLAAEGVTIGSGDLAYRLALRITREGVQ